MPTLARRQDGCYIVRHFHGQFMTWQITADGVMYLQRRGVNEGGSFSTERFMQLWMNGWVYTGDHPGLQPIRPVGDPDVPSELRQAIQSFHVALRNGDETAAKAYMWKPEDISDAPEPVEAQRSAEQPRIHSWRLRDVHIWRLDGVLPNVDTIATVSVGIRPLRSDALPGSLNDFDEYWLKMPLAWLVLWSGLRDKGG